MQMPRCGSVLMCMLTGKYTFITQSDKVILSYCPMSPNGMQPALCEGAQGAGAVCQAVCLQTKGKKQAMPWALVPN